MKYNIGCYFFLMHGNELFSKDLDPFYYDTGFIEHTKHKCRFSSARQMNSSSRQPELDAAIQHHCTAETRCPEGCKVGTKDLHLLSCQLPYSAEDSPKPHVGLGAQDLLISGMRLSGPIRHEWHLESCVTWALQMLILNSASRSLI